MMEQLKGLPVLIEMAREAAQLPWVQAALAFALLWLLGAWRAFKAEFSAAQWALKPERHKALKALAYAGALPFRLLFAAFAGFVEALVWAFLAGFVYLLWRVWHG